MTPDRMDPEPAASQAPRRRIPASATPPRVAAEVHQTIQVLLLCSRRGPAERGVIVSSGQAQKSQKAGPLARDPAFKSGRRLASTPAGIPSAADEQHARPRCCGRDGLPEAGAVHPRDRRAQRVVVSSGIHRHGTSSRLRESRNVGASGPRVKGGLRPAAARRPPHPPPDAHVRGAALPRKPNAVPLS